MEPAAGTHVFNASGVHVQPPSSRLCLPLLLCFCVGSGRASQSEDYPIRPITVIVPVAAGGSTDTLTRRIMARVSKVVGQPVVIENRAGGNLVVAGSALLAAPRDGYTFLSTANAQVNAKALTPLPYDPLRDFRPVGKLATGHFVFAVSPRLPVHNFSEFIEFARARTVSHGAFAPSSLGNVFAETLNRRHQTQIATAMYRGEAPIVTDLLGGTLDACFCQPGSVLQHARAGKLRLLAYTGPGRHRQFPEVPTFGELGFTGSPYNFGSWLGILAAAGVPQDRIHRFTDALREVMRQPDVVAGVEQAYMTVQYEAPADFLERLSTDYENWLSDVRRAGIKIE